MSGAPTPTLARDGEGLACAACGTRLAGAGEAWKARAVRKAVPLAAVGPGYATPTETDVVLVHFYCPNCAALLDTETARPGDPSLDDRVAG